MLDGESKSPTSLAKTEATTSMMTINEMTRYAIDAGKAFCVWLQTGFHAPQMYLAVG